MFDNCFLNIYIFSLDFKSFGKKKKLIYSYYFYLFKLKKKGEERNGWPLVVAYLKTTLFTNIT